VSAAWHGLGSALGPQKLPLRLWNHPPNAYDYYSDRIGNREDAAPNGPAKSRPAILRGRKPASIIVRLHMTTATTVARARDEILPMSVGQMAFLVDRLYQDCSPLQFLRELTKNAFEGADSAIR